MMHTTTQQSHGRRVMCQAHRAIRNSFALVKYALLTVLWIDIVEYGTAWVWPSVNTNLLSLSYTGVDSGSVSGIEPITACKQGFSPFFYHNLIIEGTRFYFLNRFGSHVKCGSDSMIPKIVGRSVTGQVETC